MSAVQMRPTFLLETESSEEEVIQCFKDFVSLSPDDYHGQFTGHHAVISIHDSKRHFWSPWMHLEIRDKSQCREIFGRFSPHPSVWTGFMFSYLAIAVLIFFAAVFGLSQQLSGQSPWAYSFIPLGLFVAAILWFASKAGQRLAYSEMKQMKLKIEDSIGN